MLRMSGHERHTSRRHQDSVGALRDRAGQMRRLTWSLAQHSETRSRVPQFPGIRFRSRSWEWSGFPRRAPCSRSPPWPMPAPCRWSQKKFLKVAADYQRAVPGGDNFTLSCRARAAGRERHRAEQNHDPAACHRSHLACFTGWGPAKCLARRQSCLKPGALRAQDRLCSSGGYAQTLDKAAGASHSKRAQRSTRPHSICRRVPGALARTRIRMPARR